MMIASEESLDLLNSKLDSPIPMDRFRPNIVVTGCDPHAEVISDHYGNSPMHFHQREASLLEPLLLPVLYLLLVFGIP